VRRRRVLPGRGFHQLTGDFTVLPPFLPLPPFTARYLSSQKESAAAARIAALNKRAWLGALPPSTNTPVHQRKATHVR